jgi:transcription antitermination factor NusG
MADEVWRPGDLVRVLAGAFAELTGTVEEVYADRARLRVHLAVMGANYRVELDFDEVEGYDPNQFGVEAAMWRRGAPVRILTGPFQNLSGVVLAAYDHCQRVIVRLDGLRPELSVELEYRDIESA